MNTLTIKVEENRVVLTQELLDAWIEALRSGKHEQGYNALKHDHCIPNTFCCLGVLREVILEVVDVNERSLFKTMLMKDSLLVDMRTGRDTEDSMIKGLSYVRQSFLATLNDSERYSFVTIAKWLEQNLSPKE